MCNHFQSACYLAKISTVFPSCLGSKPHFLPVFLPLAIAVVFEDSTYEQNVVQCRMAILAFFPGGWLELCMFSMALQDCNALCY